MKSCCKERVGYILAEVFTVRPQLMTLTSVGTSVDPWPCFICNGITDFVYGLVYGIFQQLVFRPTLLAFVKFRRSLPVSEQIEVTTPETFHAVNLSDPWRQTPRDSVALSSQLHFNLKRKKSCIHGSVKPNRPKGLAHFCISYDQFG